VGGWEYVCVCVWGGVCVGVGGCVGWGGVEMGREWWRERV